jgi:hypothetical protein
MKNDDLLSSYNYDQFVPEKFQRWMNFETSPALGQRAPDFPLWHLDGRATQLSAVWDEHRLTIVEFGSFT